MDNMLIELSKYRYEQAQQCLKSAKILEENNDFKGSANRSYYAIFHGMRSVLALDKADFSKHSGVSAYFRKKYIKTGIFEVFLSDIIREAFDVRSDSDYDDFFVISKEEVKQQIKNAELFLSKLDPYLQKRYLDVK